MHSMKCSYCDVTLRTITSIIFWLDVIICGCILFVQISDAQDESCLQGREDCSVYYHISECLAVNIILGLVAIYGVRKNKPNFLLPFITCKLLTAMAVVIFTWFWNYFMDLEVRKKWVPHFDHCNAFAIFIIFGFQLYLIFISIWTFQTIRKTVSACRTQKSFKSVISIWINGPSNLANTTNESTCIIENA